MAEQAPGLCPLCGKETPHTSSQFTSRLWEIEGQVQALKGQAQRLASDLSRVALDISGLVPEGGGK
ncbi:MAG TPA: hypothetical protein VMU09_11110 [Acidimicrobiales bacterium]|nr:hypothetical protein [Acidimicrobiales bacterium]